MEIGPQRDKREKIRFKFMGKVARRAKKKQIERKAYRGSNIKRQKFREDKTSLMKKKLTAEGDKLININYMIERAAQGDKIERESEREAFREGGL